MYFFAAIAKLYLGWLDGTFSKILFSGSPFSSLKPLLNHHSFHLFIAYSYLLFDLLIVPLFLYKETRTIGFVAAVLLHIFKAIFLQIGFFPFFALKLVIFCYPPDFIRSLFLSASQSWRLLKFLTLVNLF
jgi:vitamin K-dependent gamma-carboxylase